LVKRPNSFIQVLDDRFAFFSQFQKNLNFFFFVLKFPVKLDILFQVFFSLLKQLKLLLIAPALRRGQL
jgi:hypothetical protein